MKSNKKRYYKRLLSWILVVVLCFGIIPLYETQSHAADETVAETLPTDFEIVTPRDFGIADYTENDGTTYTNTKTPVQSVDKVMLKANVSFGRTEIKYLHNAANGAGIILRGRENLLLYNYVSQSAGIYVGGEYVEGEYINGTLISGRHDYYTIYASKISSTQNFDTLEIALALTTEFVDFDGQGTANDIKLGVWINGVLYDNTYIYLRNCLDVYQMYLDMNVKSMSSPYTLPTGYMKVTPADFGIADYTENDGTFYTGTEVTFDTADKVMLQANVTFGRTQLNYLHNPITGGGIRLLGAENLVLFNYLTPSAGIYVGGEFVNDEYVNGTLIAGRDEYYTIRASRYSNTQNFDTLEFFLAMTTEFVDFDGEGVANDLKLGIWIDGKLNEDTYIYLRNCLEVYQLYLDMNIKSVYSPIDVAPEFEEISFDNFNIQNGTYGYNGVDFAVMGYYGGGFKNKTFVGTVNFSETAGSNIIIAGAASPWEGVYLVTRGSEGLTFATAYDRFPSVKINPEDVEVALRGEEIEVALSVEVGDFDDDGAKDDVRFWLYLEGVLYKNRPIVTAINYAQYIGNYLGIYCDNENANVTVKTPFFEDYVSNMPEGYNVVTPLTFSVPDTADEAGISVKTAEEDYVSMSIDKVLFSARVRFNTSVLESTVEYLRQDNIVSGIRFQLYPQASSSPRIFNRMTTGDMYAGGSFVDGVYQKDAYDPIPYGGEFIIDKTVANVNFFTSDFVLWYTTEFVDFDGDGSEDDLKLGMWFNGKLYNDMYFYILDCNNTVYQRGLRVDQITSIQSDVMFPADIGVEAGEYVSQAGEFTTAELVSNKELDRTELATEVRFEGQGAMIYYGCTLDDKEKAIKITSNAEGLLVTHTFGEQEEELVQFTKRFVGTELLNHTFDLKFITEFIDADADGNMNDVQLKICVENKAKTVVIKDAATLMTATMRVKGGETGTVLIGPFAQDEPEVTEWCLDENVAFEVVKAEDATKLTVDGAKYEECARLNMPGLYSVVQIKEGKVYMQDVTVYRSYDVNADNYVGSQDLVKMIKIADKDMAKTALASLEQVGMKAIGYNKDTWSSTKAEEAVQTMRTTIVTSVEPEISVMELMEVEGVDTYSFDFIGGTDVMPIGGFYGPKEEHATDEYFSMIQESGVNLILFSELYYDRSPEVVKKTLELGEKYGVGITVNDRRYEMAGEDLTLTQAQSYLNDYKDYAAFCGIYGVDEPHSATYPIADNDSERHVSKYAKRLNTLAELDVWTYGNLLACTGQSVKDAYDAYVEEWLNTCDVKMLMWDHYVHDTHVNVADYFYSLSYGREKATSHNIPFWTFIQAGSQWRGRTEEAKDSNGYYPNEGEFLWNVNTSLAYGAKGISYFPLLQPTYFAVAESQEYDYERNGMIGASGNKNRWWYYAQTANKQIAAVDEVLMNAVSKGVIVTSEQAKADNVYSSCIIEGTAWRELTNITGDVMVGCFYYEGKSAYYVVNYDMEYAQNITMSFSDNYAFNVIQGAEKRAVRNDSFELNLKAGEGVLVVME